MRFEIDYLYKDVKKSATIHTNVDLDAMSIYYVEKYIKRMKLFPFDVVLDVQYSVDIENINDLKDETIRITDDMQKPMANIENNELKNK